MTHENNLTKRNVSVVVCAGGKGTRAGFSQNKLLQTLGGISVLERTLAALSLPEINEIVVAAAKDDFDAIRPLCAKYGARLVEGGKTRFHSVENALQSVNGEIVLVHDGARPFVTSDVISRCIESVEEHGSGICAVPSTDTLARADENGDILDYPPRGTTYRIQTPQGFFSSDLKNAYARARADGKVDFTDDSSVYSAYVKKARLCLGDPSNVKLTYASDFSKSFARVGFGVDTHAFGRDRNYIVLGGVKVPSHSGLIAHSDGDVLAHAVMDALLSASGLRDIGYYFPDTDEKWHDANSMQMLQEVVRLTQNEGFRAANVSVSVQAEKPRLAKYIDEIRRSIAAALSLPVCAVGVAAGTNEKLGYVGEGKGITVYASVLLKEI